MLCSLALLGCLGIVGCTDKDRDSNGNPAGILEIITLQPDPLRLAVGGTATLTAQGTYRDGTTKDISKSVTWESGDKTIFITVVFLFHGFG